MGKVGGQVARRRERGAISQLRPNITSAACGSLRAQRRWRSWCLEAAGCSSRYGQALQKRCGAVPRSVIAAKHCLVFYGKLSQNGQKSKGWYHNFLQIKIWVSFSSSSVGLLRPSTYQPVKIRAGEGSKLTDVSKLQEISEFHKAFSVFFSLLLQRTATLAQRSLFMQLVEKIRIFFFFPTTEEK